MIDPAILRALQAAGCTIDQIIAAVEADAELDQARRERKRANNRERQRRFREAHNADNALHDVTGVSNASTPSLDKKPPDPEKLIPTPCVGETRARGPFPPPEGVEPEQWRAFCQQRKKRLTDRAYALICGKLTNLAEHGFPPGKMIDLAIERGWETVFEPKDRSNGHHQPNGLRGSRPDPSLDMLRDAIAEEAAGRGPPPDRGAGASLPALRPG